MSPAADSQPAGTAPVRLARYLAAGGIASRRACESLILAGRVRVNGTLVPTPAYNVIPGRDQVECDGVVVAWARPLYLMLNKPVGYTCSARDEHATRLVHELIPPALGRLFTVGRLDRDSEGLLLLTNDGDLAQHLAHPSGAVGKIYQVEVRGTVSPTQLQRLRAGLWDEGEFLCPQAVEEAGSKAGRTCLRVQLQEGRKREIRRLCRAVGLPVQRLQRLSLGPLELGDLPTGAWRELSPPEVEVLWRTGTARPQRPRAPS